MIMWIYMAMMWHTISYRQQGLLHVQQDYCSFSAEL